MIRNLYSCLQPAYNELEHWGSSTTLSISAIDKYTFWESDIDKINGFAILPITSSITTCEKVAGDESGEGLYSSRFSDKNKTDFSRKLTALEKNKSSTYHEHLVILSIYKNPSGPLNSIRGQH